MTELVRASISIEKELMEQFDTWIARSGHSNRSESLRDLIRARLQEEVWADGEDVVASVSLLYDHGQRKLSQQIESHGHEHHDVVLSSMHIHLNHDLCLEVVVLRGAPQEVQHVAAHLIGLPGVLHGHAVYSRLDRAPGA